MRTYSGFIDMFYKYIKILYLTKKRTIWYYSEWELYILKITKAQKKWRWNTFNSVIIDEAVTDNIDFNI